MRTIEQTAKWTTLPSWETQSKFQETPWPKTGSAPPWGGGQKLLAVIILCQWFQTWSDIFWLKITLQWANLNFDQRYTHPGLAEIFAPDGVSGSDIMENFRQ